MTMLGLIRAYERDMGYQLITDAPWLNRKDWYALIASEDGNRVRLVLMDAAEPGTGAMTRLIAGIEKAGKIPVIVEPMGRLRDWCKKNGWKKRIIGKGWDRQEVWHPK